MKSLSKPSQFLNVLLMVYWVALLLLPFLPVVLNNVVMDRLQCGYATTCFKYVLPFYSEQGIHVVVAATLLWPASFYGIYRCIRHLKAGRQQQLEIDKN